jgi:hypothetical protein
MEQTRLRPAILVLVIFLAVVLDACAPIVERETELGAVKVTVTRSVMQTAVPTHTPNPTATQTSASQPMPASSPTATSTSTVTATLIPTPEVLHSYTSPSGEWIATFEEGYFFNEPDSFLFRVVNDRDEVEWVIEHLVPDPTDGGLMGILFPVAFDWSNDEQMMYFTYRGFGDGCGPFRDRFGLSRVDLKTGQTEELIATREGYWVAVAPNDEKAAYLKFGQRAELMLLDFATKEKVVVELDYDPAIEYVIFSDLTWSPDSDSLLVFGAEDVCATGMLLDGRYFINRINTQSLLQNTIVDDATLREILDWPEPDKVLLSVSVGNAQHKNVWLNPETGEITPTNE